MSASRIRRWLGALSLRDTRIGGRPHVAVAWIMAALAIAVMMIDLFVVPGEYWNRWLRAAPALAAIAIYAALLRGDRAALGWTLRPQPSPRYWIRATVIMAILVGVLVGAGAFYVLVLQDGPLKFPEAQGSWADRIWYFCVEGPAMEEVIYRAAIVTGLVAALRAWPAVVLSSAAFGFLHFIYGNPAPNNVLGGLFFAWAYLRSGTLVLPFALHALGNFAVLVLNHAGQALLT